MNACWKEGLLRVANAAMSPISPKCILLGKLQELCGVIE